MEVILQEDISTLGKAGEVVKVRDGYGRNYLLPRKKAVIASSKKMKELEHNKKVIAARQAKIVEQANELKNKLEAHIVTLAREVGQEDKLFGSVTSHDIAESLRLASFVVDKTMIHLAEPIKAVGVFDVSVRLPGSVSATVKVSVVKR